MVHCVSEEVGFSLEEIHHSYGGSQVITGLNMMGRQSEVVCMLGASGCGKTTTLKVIAGLERQMRGIVRVDGNVVSDEARHLPPGKRQVGLLFQDYALFPHMTVLQNVMFGIREKDVFNRRHIAMNFLERLRISHLADHYPHALSGGEQQRVALARAVAPSPRVVLMDEPFSSLDTRLRNTVRDETLALLREENATVVLVTHEPDEALRMADIIVFMRAGRIMQQGEPYHIYNYPVDRITAEFFSDVNIIRSVVRYQQADTVLGRVLTPGFVDGDSIEIVFRPQSLNVSLEEHGQYRHIPWRQSHDCARGFINRSFFLGSHSLLEVRMPHDDSVLIATVPGVCLPEKGSKIWLSLIRSECFIFKA